jgi:hypothetical protein
MKKHILGALAMASLAASLDAQANSTFEITNPYSGYNPNIGYSLGNPIYFPKVRNWASQRRAALKRKRSKH